MESAGSGFDGQCLGQRTAAETIMQGGETIAVDVDVQHDES